MSRTTHPARVFLSVILLLSSLATSVFSTPASTPCSSITASQIIQISPNSTACNATAQFADECRTAEQATPFVNAAFGKYDIATLGEQVALLSLMLFESGGFQFNRNQCVLKFNNEVKSYKFSLLQLPASWKAWTRKYVISFILYIIL